MGSEGTLTDEIGKRTGKRQQRGTGPLFPYQYLFCLSTRGFFVVLLEEGRQATGEPLGACLRLSVLPCLILLLPSPFASSFVRSFVRPSVRSFPCSGQRSTSYRSVFRDIDSESHSPLGPLLPHSGRHPVTGSVLVFRCIQPTFPKFPCQYVQTWSFSYHCIKVQDVICDASSPYPP